MEPVDEEWERAIAIVAHPDDLEYGAASAVARWTAQGKRVDYVLATSGEAGIAGIAPELARPLREEEQRASAAVVGVEHVEFLGHRDGEVEYGLALRRDLAGAIRRLRPQVLIGMNFELTWGGTSVNHADHRAVGVAALDACRDAANGWMFPELGEPWGGLRAAYYSGVAEPTHFVDVGATIGRGVDSLRAHRAYIEGLGQAFDPEEFLRNICGFAGAAAGCELAVLFRRFSPL